MGCCADPVWQAPASPKPGQAAGCSSAWRLPHFGGKPSLWKSHCLGQQGLAWCTPLTHELFWHHEQAWLASNEPTTAHEPYQFPARLPSHRGTEVLTCLWEQWELVDGPDALDLVTEAGPLSEPAAAQVGFQRLFMHSIFPAWCIIVCQQWSFIWSGWKAKCQIQSSLHSTRLHKSSISTPYLMLCVHCHLLQGQSHMGRTLHPATLQTDTLTARA